MFNLVVNDTQHTSKAYKALHTYPLQSLAKFDTSPKGTLWES